MLQAVQQPSSMCVTYLCTCGIPSFIFVLDYPPTAAQVKPRSALGHCLPSISNYRPQLLLKKFTPACPSTKSSRLLDQPFPVRLLHFLPTEIRVRQCIQNCHIMPIRHDSLFIISLHRYSNIRYFISLVLMPW